MDDQRFMDRSTADLAAAAGSGQAAGRQRGRVEWNVRRWRAADGDRRTQRR
jgi:hypothetical protein